MKELNKINKYFENYNFNLDYQMIEHFYSESKLENSSNSQTEDISSFVAWLEETPLDNEILSHTVQQALYKQDEENIDEIFDFLNEDMEELEFDL